MSRQVLVIEDDEDIANLVKLQSAELSCLVKLAFDGAVGLAEAQGGHYDLVILDMMLPGMDGLEICRRIRGGALRPDPDADRQIERDRSRARAGNRRRRLPDQALQRPGVGGARQGDFPPRRQLPTAADAKAVIRAEACASTSPAPVELERPADRADRQGIRPAGAFARNPGRVFTRAQLLDSVWGYTHSGYEHTVNSHINRLRTKLERRRTSRL